MASTNEPNAAHNFVNMQGYGSWSHRALHCEEEYPASFIENQEGSFGECQTTFQTSSCSAMDTVGSHKGPEQEKKGTSRRVVRCGRM
jgi:hypothetical protein